MLGSVQDLSEEKNATSAESIARILKEQSAISVPFFRIGPRCIIALNIPQSLQYDERLSAHYGPKRFSAVISLQNQPHIYELATRAFMAMMDTQSDQTIILRLVFLHSNPTSFNELLIDYSFQIHFVVA